MQDTSALGRAIAMVRDLRKRCPWDRAQTRSTLRPYLVEEVLELDQALGDGSPDTIRDELSDLLLHLGFQLVIAEERGEFSAAEVSEALERKMRRRHPHLFDLGPAESWENLKRKEAARGILDGLPAALPELLKAYRLQQRAASVGFDWPNVSGPLAKVREELREVELALPNAGSEQESHLGESLEEEIGDLLFAAVNLARKAGVQPTLALDRANRKFTQRFHEVERLASHRGIDVHSAGLEVLDGLWEEAKRSEK